DSLRIHGRSLLFTARTIGRERYIEKLATGTEAQVSLADCKEQGLQIHVGYEVVVENAEFRELQHGAGAGIRFKVCAIIGESCKGGPESFAAPPCGDVQERKGSQPRVFRFKKVERAEERVVKIRVGLGIQGCSRE